MQRRELLQAGLAGMMIGTSQSVLRGADPAPKNETADRGRSIRDRICLFTDLVDDFGYSYQDVASMIRQLKIAGPDLTVRSGGLVPPERVAEELPKAATAFREQGLSIPMISTGITSPTDAIARATLTTMGKLGIRYYKLGYYRYGDLAQWESQLDATRKDLAGLIQLGEVAGVEAGFHNHAGPTVGGAMWDLGQLLQSLNPKWVGSYFDVAHATIEGGEHAWKLGFQRLAGRFKMISIKDFVWEKVDGRWKSRWCPLGEGMVRWSEFFKMLAAVPFDGPISLHIEYDPGGKTPAARMESSMAAAERDLKFLRQKIDEVYPVK
jgi:L-ribulose-5-phosphate 3-epimerase